MSARFRRSLAFALDFASVAVCLCVDGERALAAIDQPVPVPPVPYVPRHAQA